MAICIPTTVSVSNSESLNTMKAYPRTSQHHNLSHHRIGGINFPEDSARRWAFKMAASTNIQSNHDVNCPCACARSGRGLFRKKRQPSEAACTCCCCFCQQETRTPPISDAFEADLVKIMMEANATQSIAAEVLSITSAPTHRRMASAGAA